jgi:hypothetical protein
VFEFVSIRDSIAVYNLLALLRTSSPLPELKQKFRLDPNKRTRGKAPLSGCALNRSVQHRLQSIGWRFEAKVVGSDPDVVRARVESGEVCPIASLTRPFELN